MCTSADGLRAPLLPHPHPIEDTPRNGKGHPGLRRMAWGINCRRRPTLPHTFACSTIGPAGLNCRVRDGNGWRPRGMITGKLEPFCGRELGAAEREPAGEIPSPGRGISHGHPERTSDDVSQLNRLGISGGNGAWLGAGARPARYGRHALGKSYGQAERAISTGKLSALLHAHLQPINQVVFLGPS